MDCIYPYVKSTAVFHCPDDPGWAGSGQYTPYTQLTSASNNYYGSYAINASYYFDCPQCGPGNCGDLNCSGSGIQTSQLLQPSQTIWVADGTDSYQFDWGGPQPSATPSNISNPAPKNLYAGAGLGIGSENTGTGDGARSDGSLQEVHGGPDLVNIIWCDGHVKALKISNLLATNSYGQYGYFTMQGPN
jgi:prepilin-type processing-associated H-X9-DG protein